MLIISDIILFANVLFVVVLRLQLPFGLARLHSSAHLLVFVLEAAHLLLCPLQLSVELEVVLLPFPGLRLQVHLQILVFFRLHLEVLFLGQLLSEAEKFEDYFLEFLGNEGGNGPERFLLEVDFPLQLLCLLRLVGGFVVDLHLEGLVLLPHELVFIAQVRKLRHYFVHEALRFEQIDLASLLGGILAGLALLVAVAVVAEHRVNVSDSAADAHEEGVALGRSALCASLKVDQVEVFVAVGEALPCLSDPVLALLQLSHFLFVLTRVLLTFSQPLLQLPDKLNLLR